MLAEALVTNFEVVKPDTSPPRTDRRMSPTRPRTTSAAPFLMLYPAGWAWGITVSHGGSVMMPDDTALEETLDEALDKALDEMAAELRVVLLTETLAAFELCGVFDACDSF